MSTIKVVAGLVFLGAISGLSTPGVLGESTMQGPATGDLCRPSPEVDAELERLGFDFVHVFQHASYHRPCGGSTDCWRQRILKVEELLERYPSDLFLHRAFQDLLRYEHGGDNSDDLLAKYRRRLEQNPDDALSHHLLGRVEPDPEQRRQAQEEALRLHPEFAWSHLELAYQALRQDGSKAAFEQLERFMSRCPDRAGEPLMAAFLLGRSAAQPLAPERLQRLRAAVERSSDRRRIRDLPVLWTLAFRAAEPAEQPAVRARIRADLDALEALELETDFDFWTTLRRGYEMAVDADALTLTRVEDAMLERFPCVQALVHLRLDRWRAEHEPPAKSATEEARQAFARNHLDLATKWTELCPDEFLFRRERFTALSELATTEPETLLAEGERLVSASEATLGNYRFRRDAPHRQVAEQLLERRVFLDRAAELLGRERELRDELYGPPPQASSNTDTEPPSPADYYRLGWQKHQLLIAGVATAQRRLDDAEAALTRVAEDLAGLEPVLAETRAGPVFAATRAHYWQRRGDLAVASGSRLDAVAFYRKVSFLDSENEAALRRARELWQALGGGPEGFRQLVDVAAGEASADAGSENPSWIEVERSLPELRLTDLEGKVWSLEDLDGKAVFVNLWATWCAPCMSEIPYLKHLAKLLEGRQDLVFLTFNVDDNPGLVVPFVARREITYPVLYAKDYVAEAVQSLSLPISWILGPDGKVRYEQKGFDSGEDKDIWAAQVLALLDTVVGP